MFIDMTVLTVSFYTSMSKLIKFVHSKYMQFIIWLLYTNKTIFKCKYKKQPIVVRDNIMKLWRKIKKLGYLIHTD